MPCGRTKPSRPRVRLVDHLPHARIHEFAPGMPGAGGWANQAAPREFFMHGWQIREVDPFVNALGLYLGFPYAVDHQSCGVQSPLPDEIAERPSQQRREDGLRERRRILEPHDALP